MKRTPFLVTGAFLLLLLTGCSDRAAWELVWADEFDSPGAPDPEYWGYETGFVRNRELQYYTDTPQNVTVSEGKCIITARLEGTDSITSASINTRGKLDFLYGRVEVKAKIPSALGTWPAIWMLGTSRGEVSWPECGEIDIMEHVGFDPERVHANIHTKAYNHVLKTNKGSKIEVKEPWSDYHIYALEWFEDHMDFFYDDSLYFTYRNDMEGNNDTWPFDKPHYLLMNLAYGGSWGGREGVDTTLLPLRFEIDYVRYYNNAGKE